MSIQTESFYTPILKRKNSQESAFKNETHKKNYFSHMDSMASLSLATQPPLKQQYNDLFQDSCFDLPDEDNNNNNNTFSVETKKMPVKLTKINPSIDINVIKLTNILFELY